MSQVQALDVIDEVTENATLGEIVRRIIDLGRTPSVDRRESFRGPYFCTAMIQQRDDSLTTPAYVHDISDEGIGFIHGAPVNLGEATVILNPNGRDSVTIRTHLVWCHAYGSGWYRSGGELVEVVKEFKGRASRK